MWFKTRVGLYQLVEPLEICVGSYLDEKIPNYSIYVRMLKEQTFNYTGVFGKAKASNPSVHLVLFRVSDTTQAAIAQCMKLIEDAICSDAKICDLSAAGDPDAWSDIWTKVEWQA